MRRFFAIFLLLITGFQAAFGQCAMCATQLENNVSNGDVGIAAGINIGILYLLAMPYLAVFVIGYFWFKNTRNHGKQRLGRGIA